MSQKYNFPPISVFCGASNHATTLPMNAGHLSSIKNFGRIMAENKISLVWGAGETGMMGAISRSVLDHGGQAIGVSTYHLLYGREGVQPDLSLLLVADDMQARKLTFAKLSCAFIIFPGGAGTSDEAYEYLLEREYGEHPKPLVIVNLEGFYDPFFKDIHRAVREGYIDHEIVDTIVTVTHEDQILPALKDYFAKYPDQPTVPRSLDPDDMKPYLEDEVVLGHDAKGGRNVTLKDAMIPLEMIGPGKLATSVALWTAGAEQSLQNEGLRRELEKVVHSLGTKRYRLVHSGQNSGLKGMVSKMIADNKYRGIGVASLYSARQKRLATGLKYLLIRRNEQSVDFTIKALSGLFVLTPGGIDVREKLFEYLTEVDIQEHDKPILLWNYEGHYDDLLANLRYLFNRGYMNERAVNKVQVVSTADELLSQIERYLPNNPQAS